MMFKKKPCKVEVFFNYIDLKCHELHHCVALQVGTPKYFRIYCVYNNHMDDLSGIFDLKHKLPAKSSNK